MSTMTRSGRGLDTAPEGVNWRLRGLCTNPDNDPAFAANPDWWIVTKSASADNDKARAICGRCPVRTQCRDFALGLTNPSARGIIAGGWTFRTKPESPPVPHPADRRRGLKQAPQQAAPRYGKGSAAVLAAARRLLAGTPISEVCARTDLSVSSVRDGAAIRRWTPDLVPKVLAGEMPFKTALEAARAARAAAVERGEVSKWRKT